MGIFHGEVFVITRWDQFFPVKVEFRATEVVNQCSKLPLHCARNGGGCLEILGCNTIAIMGHIH